MRRLLPIVLLALLCACAPAGTPQPGYDTPWYRAFPTPTPTPSPTPTPVPATPQTTPVPRLSVETDAFSWTLPAGYTELAAGDGQRVFEAADGRQLLYTFLDAATAETALALPLSLLSAAVKDRLGGALTFTDRSETLLAGRSAVLLTGTSETGGQTVAVRAYAVTVGDTCHIFVLSWAGGEPADAFDALVFQ